MIGIVSKVQKKVGNMALFFFFFNNWSDYFVCNFDNIYNII